MTAKTALVLLTSTLGLLCAQAPASNPTGRIHITVLDSVTEQPVSGVLVVLQGGSPVHSSHGDSGPQGTLELTGLPFANYAVLQTQVPHYSMIRSGLSATITPQQSAADLTIHIDPAAQISGNIVDEQGRPAKYAEVSAWTMTPNIGGVSWFKVQLAYTDANGHYELRDLAPGTYLLSAGTRLSFTPYETVFYPASNSARSALRFQVQPGAKLDRLDFRLFEAPQYHIRGSVSGRTTQEHTSLSVQPCPDGEQPLASTIASATVGAAGAFEVDRVGPGTYCLRYSESDANFIHTLAFGTTRVTVADRDLEGVQLQANPGHDVEGRITGAPATREPLFINLYPVAPYPANGVLAKVDAEKKSFVFPHVLPIDYRISITAVAGFYVKSIRQGIDDFSSGLYPAGQAGPLTLDFAPARGRLSGRVDLSQVLSPHVAVILLPQGAWKQRSDLRKMGYASASGEFSIADLAPGTYKILAWANYDPALAQSPEFLDLLPGTLITLADGEQRSMDLRPVPASTIQEAKSRF